MSYFREISTGRFGRSTSIHISGWPVYQALGSENAVWMLARIPNPCLINNGFPWPKVIKGQSSPVQLVSAISEPCSLKNLIRVATGFRSLSQKRDHQFLRFNKACGKLRQAQFTKTGLGFGYQLRLTEIAEVPREAVYSEAYVKTVSRRHSPEPLREHGDCFGKSAVVCVLISHSTCCQKCEQFL